MFSRFKSPDRVLGMAKKTRRYDLPLNKGSGGLYLIVLIALMSFLSVLALTSSFALSEMTDRWTSGLENQASIEVPAEDEGGNTIEPNILKNITTRIYGFLNTHPAIESAIVMSDEDISKLVSPWLGEDMELSNIPLPGIITVKFKADVAFDMENLKNNIKDLAPQARIDLHEGWLANVLRFTGALNFASLLVSFVIGVTTIVAVGGAVQSRMAIYKEDLELLHLMGASDVYISRQLQRYILIIALKGAAVGVIVGFFMLMIIGWFMGRMDINLIPDFSLNKTQIVMLVLLIPLTALVGMITARQTVLRALRLMP
jgi:cell division transport system permease protein